MLGVHLSLPSYAGDIFRGAKSYSMDTFQVFMRNNRNLSMRKWSPYDIDYWNKQCFYSGITAYVVHAPYTMNPGSADTDKHARCVSIIKEDLLHLQKLAGRKYYVLHPGSANTCSVSEALLNLKSVLEEVEPYKGTTVIAIEMMAGQGTQLLCDFFQIKWCVDNIPGIRFCYDTCHVFASGMHPFGVLQAFEDYIDVVHLNGSSAPQGSHVDRHSSLFKGYLSSDDLRIICEYWVGRHTASPVILETPGETLLEDYMKMRSTVAQPISVV